MRWLPGAIAAFLILVAADLVASGIWTVLEGRVVAVSCGG